MCALLFFFSFLGWVGRKALGGALGDGEGSKEGGGGIELRMMINAGGIDGICGANKKYPGSDSGIRSESKVGRGRGKQGELDEEMGG